MTSPERRMRVAHVGIWPPPYGGVPVHIVRLRARLEEHGVDVTVLDWGGTRTAAKEADPSIRVYGGPLVLRGVRIVGDLIGQRWDIVHWHVASGRLFAWMAGPAMRLGRARNIVTVHSGYILDLDPGSLQWRVLRRVLAMADCIIAVNEAVAAHLRRQLPPPVVIEMAPAYLPPRNEPTGSYPRLDRELRSLREQASALILVSGTARPTWGIHRAVRVMQRLSSDTALVIASYGASDPGYVRDVEASAASLGRRLAWLQDLPPMEFAYLLRRCDALLRPTSADGDSVAVREALAMGVPVVASDVAPRPEGTIVFPLDDDVAFAKAIQTALTSPPPRRDDLGPQHAEIVWDAYRAASGDPRASERGSTKPATRTARGS